MGIFSRQPQVPIRSIPTPVKEKAPDLSPAVAPQGYVFYVEPRRREFTAYAEEKSGIRSLPSYEYVNVYLFDKEEEEAAKRQLKIMSHPMYYSPMVGFAGIKVASFWLNDDPVETKKWINSAMHECLKIKRHREEEKARLDSLTGFYPPKEM